MRHLAARLGRVIRHRWQRRADQRQAGDHCRRHAAGFRIPTNEQLWLPLYREFPPLPRNDPRAINPAVIGLIKRGVSLDQANAEFTSIAKRMAAEYPETNKPFNTGQVQRLIDAFTPRPLRGTLCVGCGLS
jgi:hypothetical protein